MKQRSARIRRIAERQHKSNLWGIHTIAPSFVPHLQQSFIRRIPCKRSVGTIKKHRIYLSVCKHFSVFTQHPLVGCEVIPEQRFFPIAISGITFTPCRMVIIRKGVGIVSQNLCNVLYFISRFCFTLMPCPIKNSNLLSLPFRKTIYIIRYLAPQCVCNGPHVAIHCLGNARYSRG